MAKYYHIMHTLLINHAATFLKSTALGRDDFKVNHKHVRHTAVEHPSAEVCSENLVSETQAPHIPTGLHV